MGSQGVKENEVSQVRPRNNNLNFQSTQLLFSFLGEVGLPGLPGIEGEKGDTGKYYLSKLLLLFIKNLMCN